MKSKVSNVAPGEVFSPVKDRKMLGTRTLSIMEAKEAKTKDEGVAGSKERTQHNKQPYSEKVGAAAPNSGVSDLCCGSERAASFWGKENLFLFFIWLVISHVRLKKKLVLIYFFVLNYVRPFAARQVTYSNPSHEQLFPSEGNIARVSQVRTA